MPTTNPELALLTRKRPKRKAGNTPAQELARLAVEGILSKKGFDIKVMDMRGVSGFADFFVLCTGDSDTQIKAIAEAVEDVIKEKAQEKPWHVEGMDHRQWVLLDYVDTVVHVFDRERRVFYSLERLWADAPTQEIEDAATDVVLAFPTPEKEGEGGASVPRS